MKKLVLFSLVSILGVGLFLPIKVSAQEPQVLAVTTMAKPTPLPQIMYGQNVVFKDTANGDLVVAGGQVTVEGTVNKNLFVAGGQVTLTGEVKGNVILAGGDIKVAEGSHIGGYLLTAGGKVALDGTVDGDTRVFSGDVSASEKGKFGGALFADAGKIVVADKTMVRGEKKLTEVKTNGNMPWGYWSKTMPARNQNNQMFAGVMSFFKLVELLGKVLIMLLLVKVFGSHIAEMFKTVKTEFWSIMGMGAVKLFLTPLAIILLLMTVIGIPVAILLGGLYFAAMFLSIYAASAVFGHWFVVKGWLKTKSLYWQGVAGLLALELLGFVPVVGWILKFGALLLGVGLFVKWEKSLWMTKKA